MSAGVRRETRETAAPGRYAAGRARDMHVIEALTLLHAPPLFLPQQRHRHHDMPLCGVV
jgi:hypothetical protein